jgi:MFS superfamily sulfate permease-like transporter
MQNGTSAGSVMPTKTLYLSHEMRVDYQLSDKFFVMTVIFACIDGVALASVVTLLFFYKRMKREHIKFRKHKEKWLNYDNLYKDRGFLKGAEDEIEEEDEDDKGAENNSTV